MSLHLRDFRGLTFKGRVAVLYYRLRRAFIDPAPMAWRCAMGYPLGEYAQCPRWIDTESNDLFCRRCERKAGPGWWTHSR